MTKILLFAPPYVRGCAGVPAQLFGTEKLLDVARTAVGKRLIVSQGALSSLCDGMADGRIKVLQGLVQPPPRQCCVALPVDTLLGAGLNHSAVMQSQAFGDGLRVLETVAVGCTAACESGHACGMPSTCVGVMLTIFGSSTQLHQHRLQAGRVAASLLNFHKCQRTALRSATTFALDAVCPSAFHASPACSAVFPCLRGKSNAAGRVVA